MRVGLVGTGYAARLRAEALTADPRSHLTAVAGSSLERTQIFNEPFQAEVLSDWRALIDRADIDLVIVSTTNREHAPVVRAALEGKKHVVVEYPLALDLTEAAALITLASQQNRLLHVEHIERLSGIHQALLQAIPEVGTPFYARTIGLNPQHPAPRKWTYHHELFGFPLMAAVSRLHRLIHLFGPVATVYCQTRYQNSTEGYYTACLCSAQLTFISGLLAEVVYGKGETLWQAARTLEVQGDRGAVVIEGEQGTLIRGEHTLPLDMGSRRGLFVKDTTLVLDHLTQGNPLYMTPEESLYALRVADAARRSAETGQVIQL
ncbi:glycosyl transferase family 2 [Leptolyngbya sp. 'hensonii']|nr:glycosyl transferase family 2 [Leptolyngbya sp. 'hensonii']